MKKFQREEVNKLCKSQSVVVVDIDGLSQGGGPPKREAFKALRGGYRAESGTARPSDRGVSAWPWGRRQPQNPDSTSTSLVPSCNSFDNSSNKSQRLEPPTLLPLSRRSLILQGIAYTDRLYLQPTNVPASTFDSNSNSRSRCSTSETRLFSMHRNPGRARFVHVSSTAPQVSSQAVETCPFTTVNFCYKRQQTTSTTPCFSHPIFPH